MIHWTWLIFFGVVIGLGARIWRNGKQPRGDYGFDIESPFLVVILIAFILIWGGIFWW